MNTDNIYDGVEFDPNDLESLRKEYERIRNRDKIIAVLQAEVRAWRIWFDSERTLELNEPTLYENVVWARRHTNSANALENKQ